MKTRKELRRQELESTKEMEKKNKEDETKFKKYIESRESILLKKSEELDEITMCIDDLIKAKEKYDARQEVIEKIEKLKEVIPSNTQLEHCISMGFVPTPVPRILTYTEVEEQRNINKNRIENARKQLAFSKK
jgi:hypothetical protein